jgi:glycopeptide antibiotics resistance protein
MFRIDSARYLDIDGIKYYPKVQFGSRDIFLFFGAIFILVLVKDIILGKFRFNRDIVKGLLAFVTALIVSVSMLPLMVLKHRDYFEKLGYGHQTLVGKTPMSVYFHNLSDPEARFQVFGNLIMLVPFVILMAMLYRPLRHFASIFLLSLLTSTTIEVLQFVLNYFYFSNRVFDVGDIITNTLGGTILGFIGYLLISHLFKWFVTDKPVK